MQQKKGEEDVWSIKLYAHVHLHLIDDYPLLIKRNLMLLQMATTKEEEEKEGGV